MEETVAVTPVVRRKKLTEKQFTKITEANQRLVLARSVLKEAEAHFKTVSELVLDAHDLSPEQNVQLDDETKELVILTEPASGE